MPPIKDPDARRAYDREAKRNKRSNGGCHSCHRQALPGKAHCAACRPEGPRGRYKPRQAKAA